MDKETNNESKSIGVTLVVYAMYITIDGKDQLLRSETIHGYANSEDAINYMDLLEETYRGLREKDLTIDRVSDEKLTIRYLEKGQHYMSDYHTKTTQIYY